jgi:hypothetical protein
MAGGGVVTAGFGTGVTPGSEPELATADGVLHVAESTVEGSGPTGANVTMTLVLRVAPQAAGRTYGLSLQARGDNGQQQTAELAGILRVEPQAATGEEAQTARVTAGTLRCQGR